MNKRTIGFPRMHKEMSEVRDFLPDLIRKTAPFARKLVLEEGIGSGMGISQERYTEGLNNVHIGSNQECYDQDIVLQVRSPTDDEMSRMGEGTILFSMLHYSTHPGRVRLMESLGLCPISMDEVADDKGTRIIENLHDTSWNAVRAGFRALKKTMPALASPDRTLIEVVVVGTGPVGRFAAEAATKYGDTALHREFLEQGIPGVIVHLIGRNVTRDEAALRDILTRADMFVDTTNRRDPTQILFPNRLIGALPDHAVVLDVTADPYITDTDPIQVKAIEGIMTGNLDEYEFPPDHQAFEALPPGINTEHRRMTVSCYSWPAVKPEKCMQVYGDQITGMLKVILDRPFNQLSENSDHYFERAVYRGTLEYRRG